MRKYYNYPLSKTSWIHIGGNAKEFIEVDTTKELEVEVKRCKKENIPFYVLGWGANTLISDRGFNGIIIRNNTNQIKLLNNTNLIENIKTRKIEEKSDMETLSESKASNRASISRFQSNKTEGTFRGIEFKDLDYNESDRSKITVVVDSGIGLPNAINHLLNKGITGLQWFSGIPGTIGAGVFNNIHGGTHMFSENISSLIIIDEDGITKNIKASEAGFAYDYSNLQVNRDIILKIELNLYIGDKKRAKYTAKEWAERKISQPKNSIGSIFHNISKEDVDRLKFPTPSTGYLIEHKLNLSGYKVGDAMIYPYSNNFIVNLGKATATDYLAIVRKIYKEAFDKFGLILKPEIFFLGFDSEEIQF